MTAENRLGPLHLASARRASMRPRPMTAENSVVVRGILSMSDRLQ